MRLLPSDRLPSASAGFVLTQTCFPHHALGLLSSVPAFQSIPNYGARSLGSLSVACAPYVSHPDEWDESVWVPSCVSNVCIHTCACVRAHTRLM